MSAASSTLARRPAARHGGGPPPLGPPGVQPGAIVHFGQMDDTTPVVIQTTDGAISLSVNDVRRWVHPTAPPHEAMKFLMTCRMAGVNPFLREAHLVDHGGQWTTIIDKSGYLRLAQEHPAYNGHQAGIIVRPFDQARRGPNNAPIFTGPPSEVEGQFLPPGYLLVGGWAKVYRRDRAIPTYAAISMAEYNRQQGTWNQIPCTMIRKVALVQALRESGLVSHGWYDAAEVVDDPALPSREPRIPTDRMPSPRVIEAMYSNAPEDAGCPPDLLARIEQIRQALQIPADHYVWREALANMGVSHPAELDAMAAEAFIQRLSSHLPHPTLDIAAGETINPAMAEAIGSDQFGNPVATVPSAMPPIAADGSGVIAGVGGMVDPPESFEVADMERRPRGEKPESRAKGEKSAGPNSGSKQSPSKAGDPAETVASES